MQTIKYLGSALKASFITLTTTHRLKSASTPLRLTKQCLVLLVLTMMLPLQSAANNLTLDQQRELYKEAKTTLSKGDHSRFKSILSRIGDYPLRPYLEYTELSKRLWQLPKRDVQNFLSKYHGSQITDRLRYLWLETLRKKDQWQEYQRDYKPNTATTEQQCYYHLARIRGGHQADATTEGLKLWSRGKS